MRKKLGTQDKNIELALHDILKSRARSRIYIYLLRKGGSKTDQIIKGSKLHPSTVREILSKMHDQGLIYRKKLKNDSIGKNPYLFYAIPPIKLLKRYANEIEDRLNRIANLNSNIENEYSPVKIKIDEREDDL